MLYRLKMQFVKIKEHNMTQKYMISLSVSVSLAVKSY
jgi:hypothetical protein